MARVGVATNAELAVTMLGVVGFLGFLLTARMDDVNASPFDVLAFVWFITFGIIRLCLPRLLSKLRRQDESPSLRMSSSWTGRGENRKT